MLLSSVAEIIIVIVCPVLTVDGLTDLSCIIGWSSESGLTTETVVNVVVHSLFALHALAWYWTDPVPGVDVYHLLEQEVAELQLKYKKSVIGFVEILFNPIWSVAVTVKVIISLICTVVGEAVIVTEGAAETKIIEFEINNTIKTNIANLDLIITTFIEYIVG